MAIFTSFLNMSFQAPDKIYLFSLQKNQEIENLLTKFFFYFQVRVVVIKKRTKPEITFKSFLCKLYRH